MSRTGLAGSIRVESVSKTIDFHSSSKRSFDTIDLLSLSSHSVRSGISFSLVDVSDADLCSIGLDDVFDSIDLDSLYGAFASATCVAAAVTDPRGAFFSAALGFCDYCNLVRSFPQGLANCNKSDFLFGQEAGDSDAAVCHPCYSAGLHDGAVALRLPNGLHIGNIMIGQVAPEGNLDHQREYLSELGASATDIEDVMNTIYRLPLSKFRSIAHFLFSLTSKISEFGYVRFLQRRYIQQLHLRHIECRTRDALIRGTLNSIDQAVIVLSLGDWLITRCNQATLDLFRSPVQGHYFFDLFDFLHFPSLERIFNPFEDACSKHIACCGTGDCVIFVKSDFVMLTDPEGTIRKFVYSCTPLDALECSACVLVLRDVTAQRSIQAKFAENSKFELLGRFSAFISHNANQYLQGIAGCAEALLMDNPVGLYVDKLKTILSSSLDCANLINRMRELTTANQNIFVLENVDVFELMDHIVPIVSSFDPRISVYTVCDFRKGECTVKADATQIQSAILNLCVNAVEAILSSYGDGEIRLCFRRCVVTEPDFHGFGVTPGDFVCITVEDNGVGISADKLPYVFDLFRSSKGAKSGTGIGLASVQSIVMQHSGAIFLESIVSTEFCRGRTSAQLFLPICDIEVFDDSDISRSSVCYSPGGFNQNRKVVLIDDSLIVVKAVTSLLERLSCRVVPFQNPCEAINCLERMEESPDFIIIDLIMPEIAGLEVVERIRLVNTIVPIVIASGYKYDKLDLDALEKIGVVGFIQKPFTASQLKDLLMRL